jgi:hypothetical protein
MDTWLLRYLMTPVEKIRMLRHDLVCFRILVQNGRPAEAMRVLNRILPQVSEPDAEPSDVSALKVEVIYAASFLGCSDLLRYAIDQQVYYEFDSIWVRCYDTFSQVLASALIRYLDAHEFAEFLMNLPEGDDLLAGNALTTLHRVSRADGTLLWDMDRVNDLSFTVTVGKTSCPMQFATHERVYEILERCIRRIERESRPVTYDFNFHQSDSFFDELRERAAMAA